MSARVDVAPVLAALVAEVEEVQAAVEEAWGMWMDADEGSPACTAWQERYVRERGRIVGLQSAITLLDGARAAVGSRRAGGSHSSTA